MVKKYLNDIAQFIIKSSDADYTRVLIRKTDNKLTRFANSIIHQNVSQEDISIAVEMVYGKKHGYMELNKVDNETILQNLKRLKKNILIQPDDRDFVEYPKGLSYDYEERWDDETATVTHKAMADIVGKAIQITKTVRAEGFGAFNVKSNFELIANNYGNIAYSKNTFCNLTSIPTRDEKTTYNNFSSYRIDDLDIEKFFELPLKRLEYYKNNKKIESGKYRVILEPHAVGDMLGYLSYMTFSGKPYVEKQSYITDKLGEKITGENITLYDDYNDKMTIGIPYDGELNERKKIAFIENGIARNIALDTKWAKKLGKESNGHALFGWDLPICTNIIMKTGDKSLSDMITEAKNALLITRFNYTNNVNQKKTMYTGMTRNGVYRIESGKIVGTTNNMRFTINIMEALKNVLAIGKELHYNSSGWFGGILVPALMIDNFNFTGTTKFS